MAEHRAQIVDGVLIVGKPEESKNNSKLYKISGWLRRKFRAEIVSGRELQRRGYAIKRLLGLKVAIEEIAEIPTQTNKDVSVKIVENAKQTIAAAAKPEKEIEKAAVKKKK